MGPRGPSVALTAPWGRCLGAAGLLELSRGAAEQLLPGGHWAHGRPLAAPEQGRVPEVLRRPVSPTVGPSWPQVTAPALGPALGQAGVATSYAVWAASKSFAAFLASRVIGGISKGNVSLCTAIVADLGSPSARSKGMVSAPWGLGVGVSGARVSLLAQAPSFPQALIGVAFSLGFTLGPTLGAFLPSETVPWLALLFAVSDLLFIWCFLPETLPPEKRVRWEPDSGGGGGRQGCPSHAPAPGAGEAGLHGPQIPRPC